MSENLAKQYNPKAVEDRIYKDWIENNYFHAKVNSAKEPFSIVMPPPNITGRLHMGHALDSTLQDIIVRWKRMEGYETLWQPGTDHAAIATEVKISKALAEKGIDKVAIGREAFMTHAWAWKEAYGGAIVDQLKQLGASCDWDRERFTLDKGCSDAVEEAFMTYHKKGYIYKGAKIINWCPVCETTISEAEVEHVEHTGNFWHIRYKKVGEEGYVEIATTRPETLLGDTAVAVHPEDERYKDLIGKTVILPIVNREIPVIADTYVDKEFGTGCVKITPAHDPNDFEIGIRHNLEQINVMNDDGTINGRGGKYQGMDRYEARKVLVADLEAEGYLVKVEVHQHNIGTHDRCHTVVEPLIKTQWFVKMSELAQPAIEALKTGELEFVPKRYGKIYLNWLENLHDWCISRQLWWGHRIPAYYCDDCGEIMIARENPTVCSKCGSHSLRQDEDSLDTWFSSALWPFSTLGWPEKTKELDYFYPTNVLVTGYDIIFFWVIRMVFSGLAFTKELPFKKVIIHGLIRDAKGRKMSKSLGNGIDPLEVIHAYGADALRFTLITGNTLGNDMRYHQEQVEASRNFANKLWNASRFILMNLEENKIDNYALDALTPADQWILSKVNTLTADVTKNMDKYEFGMAAKKLHDFIWEEFCDWYIEMVKPRLYSETDTTKEAALWTLKTVLTQSIKLLHPYMPFITEEIFGKVQGTKSAIMIASWPTYKASWHFEAEETAISTIKEAVRNIRNIRTNMQVAPSKKAKVYVVSEDEAIQTIFEEGRVFFATLGYASEVIIQGTRTGIDADAVSVIIPRATIYMPFSELVDIGEEVERLNGEVKKLEKELDRVQGKLANKSFIDKAPEKIIMVEREKEVKYQQMMTQVKERLKGFKRK